MRALKKFFCVLAFGALLWRPLWSQGSISPSPSASSPSASAISLALAEMDKAMILLDKAAKQADELSAKQAKHEDKLKDLELDSKTHEVTLEKLEADSKASASLSDKLGLRLQRQEQTSRVLLVVVLAETIYLAVKAVKP
jgi:hypothetical protein